MGNKMRQVIGARIRQAREDLGMTQEELGELIGHTSPTLSQWERGVRKVSLEMLTVISGHLKHDVTWFITPPGEPIDRTMPEEGPQTTLKRLLKEARVLYDRLELAEIPVIGNLPCTYEEFMRREILFYLPVTNMALMRCNPPIEDTKVLYGLYCHSAAHAGVLPGNAIIVTPNEKKMMDGKFFVVRINEDVTVRTILTTAEPDKYKLMTDAMEYEEITSTDGIMSADGSLEVLGRVVLSGGWRSH